MILKKLIIGWMTTEIGLPSSLDRQKLKQDRVGPVFMAYGLMEGLTALIKKTVDSTAKEALSNVSQELDDKERDAYESGLRRGIRSSMLKKVSDSTRNFITENNLNAESLAQVGNKLAKVIKKLKEQQDSRSKPKGGFCTGRLFLPPAYLVIQIRLQIYGYYLSKNN